MKNFIKNTARNVAAFFSLAILVINCNAQRNKQIVLKVNFEPSFASYSTFILQGATGVEFQGELVVYKDKEITKIKSREKIDIPQNKVQSIIDFMKTYDFKIKGSTDTISSERAFFRGDSTTVYKISYGNDGITINGSFDRNGVTKKFAFWSPRKDSENYRLVQMLFSIATDSFKRKTTIEHLRALQAYFR